MFARRARVRRRHSSEQVSFHRLHRPCEKRPRFFSLRGDRRRAQEWQYRKTTDLQRAFHMTAGAENLIDRLAQDRRAEAENNSDEKRYPENGKQQRAALAFGRRSRTDTARFRDRER